MFSQYRYYDISAGIDRRFDPRDPDFPKNAMWDMVNIVYERDSEKPEKMGGTIRWAQYDMGGAVNGLFDYDEGTRLVACCTDGKVYASTDYGEEFIQATGGSGFATTATVRWSGLMYYGATTATSLLILCNGVDAPQRYDSTNGVAALGSGSPATGQYPTAFGGRVVMAMGDTIFYSAINDVQDFSAPGGGSVQIDRGSGDITALYSYGGSLLIFKRDKTFRLPLGRISEAEIIRVSSSIGCSSYWTIQEIGSNDRNGLALMTEAGLQLLVGTASTEGFIYRDIGNKVKALLDRRNLGSQTTAWGLFNLDRYEYWLQYPTGSNTTPSEGLILNTARNQSSMRWTRHDRPNLTCGAIFRYAGQQLQVMGDTNGQVHRMHFNDTWQLGNYVGRIITPSLTQGAPDMMKIYNRMFVDVEANSGYNVNIRYSLGRVNLPTPTGAQTTVDPIISNDGWGVGEWGVAEWGGAGSAGDHIRFSTVRRGTYLQLTLDTLSKEEWFKLKGIVVEAERTARQVSA